jgi:septum formation protein
MKDMHVILASGSPRRRALLDMVGISCEVCIPDIEENTDKTVPSEIVKDLSLKKALSVAPKYPGQAVLAADTIVEIDGRILGKPKTEDEAFSMLKMLSGRTHSVYTGVALIFPDGSRDSFYSETRVTMFDNSDDLIRDYISTGEPMDKAGSYGIQGTGAYLVEKVDGDYGTIVGLPVSIVFRKLREYTLLHSK